MSMVSDHFSIEELARCESRKLSKENLRQAKNPEIRDNLVWLANTILEPLFAHYGDLIVVVSAFRSPELQEELGGRGNSAHLNGRACDIRVLNQRPSRVLHWIRKEGDLRAGVVKLEPRLHPQWVHIALPEEDSENESPRRSRRPPPRRGRPPEHSRGHSRRPGASDGGASSVDSGEVMRGAGGDEAEEGDEALSPNFTFLELTATQYYRFLDQNRNEARKPEILNGLRVLAQELLQPVRRHFGRPLVVHSGFRCRELNEAVGGSSSSQHCFGEAVDFHVPGHDLEEVFNWIKGSSALGYGQLILECYQEYSGRGWIHLSLQRRGHSKENLIASAGNDGRMSYRRVT